MNSSIDLERMRQISLEQPEGGVTRLLALVISAAFLLAIFHLVRRGRLKEEYTPIWVTVAVGMMILMVWFDIVRWLTRAVGAWTPSSTLFFFGELFLLVLGLNYAVRLSTLSSQVRLLGQELAILRGELKGRDRSRAETGEPPSSG
jgi:hypothetical protein